MEYRWRSMVYYGKQWLISENPSKAADIYLNRYKSSLCELLCLCELHYFALAACYPRFQTLLV